MRIFVTGGTGYVGRQLCRRLAAEGHEVRSLVRPGSRTVPLAAAGVALFGGDVTDRASMREAMSGADWVVHAAADLDLEGPAGRMEAVNVGGSENVASLAFKLGVPRLLSVSSVAYFGGSPDDGSPGNEDTPVHSTFPTRYSETKHRAERAIRAWAERGLGVVTVYPGAVYGPPGPHDGGNVALDLLWRGRVPALVGAERKVSWIFLEDLADGIVRAMARAEPGAAYVMAGEITTVRELARRVEALGGARAPRREVAIPIARLFVRLSGPLYRLAGRRPPVALSQLASLERHWAFDDGRAQRDLDWRRRSLAEGLPPALAALTAGPGARA
jgi:nucleoside-diphosphate-sugar epimerase